MNTPVQTHDELTRALSRDAFEARLEASLQKAVQTGQPLTLAMVDIDQFLLINETYGNQIGDQVLIQIRKTLSDCNAAVKIENNVVRLKRKILVLHDSVSEEVHNTLIIIKAHRILGIVVDHRSQCITGYSVIDRARLKRRTISRLGFNE